MKTHQLIQKLHDDLYNLLDADDSQSSELDNQYSVIDDLIRSINSVFPSSTDDIADNKIAMILSRAKQRIIYNHQYTSLDFTQLIEQISEELSREPTPELVISPFSILATLYYLNDIIAGSSAMGRGSEDSIVPAQHHSQVICQLLENIYKEDNPVLQMINDARHVKHHKKQETILPLIFDIVETSYARLEGWRSTNLTTKQQAVDRFYVINAESCMAKGSMYILRSLITLPQAFAQRLNDITLDSQIIENLIRCSSESRATLATEASTTRRYRGGNSGSTWIEIRNTVLLAPIHNHETLNSTPPRPISERSNSLEKDNSLFRLFDRSYSVIQQIAEEQQQPSDIIASLK